MKKEILRDNTFQHGFLVGHVSNLVTRSPILDLSFDGEKPQWQIAQWFSKHCLKQKRTIEESPDRRAVYNEGKRITRYADGSLSLYINTASEYSHPRLEGEGWPHLLIEQSYATESMKGLKSLVMSMDLDYVSLTDNMGSSRIDALHTFQVSWYLQIGNRKTGDFFWFGLPMIDNPRYDWPRKYEHVDDGKEDATMKFIDAVDPSIYMSEPLRVGHNLRFSLEVLGLVKAAFGCAQAHGYMKNANFDDLELFTNNFGFECPGTYDGEIKIRRMSIIRED